VDTLVDGVEPLTEIVNNLIDGMNTPLEILISTFKALIEVLIGGINTPTKAVYSLIDSIEPRIEVVIDSVQA